MSQKPLTEAELNALYREGVEADLDSLGAILSRIKETEGDSAAEAFDEARGTLHNVKGQGTSFGFPLMTQIGESFHALVKFQATQPGVNPDVVQLYEAHLTAMKTIIANDIRGDGPDLLQKVAASLEEKVKHTIF
ncbi:Hpt domain-containing protein [Kiloniella laminariae]|uniref:Hpt domain-containing protein n=1 Tax=Kiloniella laminariae TaxID=454162 RepID=UPI00036B5107|nr:Hpt domain-containing protein [Kiloniella laminariae]